MPITEELNAMLVAAGRAEAHDRQTREDRQRDEGERRHRAEIAHAKLESRAHDVGDDVFAWLAEPEGRELVAAMGAAGVELLPITPWMDPCGGPRERPCSGSWRFSLASAGEIEVDHVGSIGAGRGHFRKRVANASDLVRATLRSFSVSISRLRRSTGWSCTTPRRPTCRRTSVRGVTAA